MVFGEHVAKCDQCGKTWITGDCIPSFCSTECEQEWREFWAKIEEAKEAAQAAGGLNDGE